MYRVTFDVGTKTTLYISFNKKPFNHFKDLHKMTDNSDINQMSSVGEVMSNTLKR